MTETVWTCRRRCADEPGLRARRERHGSVVDKQTARNAAERPDIWIIRAFCPTFSGRQEAPRHCSRDRSNKDAEGIFK